MTDEGIAQLFVNIRLVFGFVHTHLAFHMPKFERNAHAIMMSAGYEYNEIRDKYFNSGVPNWEAGEKADSGRRQGAWPSSSIEEFRSQEADWVSAQLKKVKEMKLAAGSAPIMTNDIVEEPEAVEDKPKKEKKKKSKQVEDADVIEGEKPKKKKKHEEEPEE